MSCTNPVTAWYSNALNPTGKRSIIFSPRQRYKGSDTQYISPLTIPCGKCPHCRASQSLMWSIRAYHESTLHEQNSFITLTYDDAHLPLDGKIDKKHLQDFFKRLRKSVYPTKLRYIACGEYGGQTRRPHYHAIIFGFDFLSDKIQLTDELYTSPTLLRNWGHGHVSIAPVTMSSICYVCGYVFKKIDDPDTFTLMSRRPGIGKTWLSLYRDDIRRTGSVTIEGREYQVPPRYLDWDDEFLASVKKQRQKYAREQSRGIDLYERWRRQRAQESNKRAALAHKPSKEKI